jgi:anti-sigma regulatory factor (Ser/Thr protein kinase)
VTSEGVDALLRSFAEGRGHLGFSFDELTAAHADRVGPAQLADWLARARASGDLVDVPSDEEGAPRYCLAVALGHGDRLDLRVPAEPASVTALRHAAARFLERHRVPDPGALLLAISEAATNAILHAYVGEQPGLVRLVMCAEPERLVVVVRDWGNGMRPRPDSPGLGLGLPTIANLADSFNVEVPDGGGTLLRMHFGRPQQRPVAA